MKKIVLKVNPGGCFVKMTKGPVGCYLLNVNIPTSNKSQDLAIENYDQNHENCISF